MKHRINRWRLKAVKPRWYTRLAERAKALKYLCAAARDERDGLQLTAAMEWRHAAELLGADSSVADYCWRQWERIMHLSRDFAAPIADSAAIGALAQPKKERAVEQIFPAA
jgi:hypothetical protein